MTLRCTALLLLLSVVGCSAAPRVPTTQPAVAVKLPGYSKDRVFQAGRMTFASQPDQRALRDAVDNGVVAVVSLRPENEWSRIGFDEKALVQELGMTFISVHFTSKTFDEADVTALHEALSEIDGPVLLHGSGSNRVGGVWAAYLSRYGGLSREDAMELGRSAGLQKASMIEATERVLDNR